MTPSSIGHYYEDFTVGEVIKHELSKTIFESDNNFFSLLTMNNHPVHIWLQHSSMILSTCVLPYLINVSRKARRIEVSYMWNPSHTTSVVKMCFLSAVMY